MNKIKNIFYNSKIMVIMLIVLALGTTAGIIFTMTFSTNNNTFYGISLNDVTVDGVNISDIEIKEENGITKYEANIKPLEERNINYIKIIFNDKDNANIVTLIGYVGTNLKSQEKKIINASTDADLSQAKSIKYEIVNRN